VATFKVMNDELVKTTFRLRFVIPAKAGILLFQQLLDSHLRGNDGDGDFLRDYHE
jgi:hypothetical protein